MNRFTIPTRDEAPAASQPLLDAVKAQLGVVPNLFRLVALSPAALQGFVSLNGAPHMTQRLMRRSPSPER